MWEAGRPPRWFACLSWPEELSTTARHRGMSRIHDSLRRLRQMKPEAVKAAYASSASDRWGMSVADRSLSAPPVPRRAPLAVRLSPEFVNTFCFGGCQADRRNAEDQLACPGLLFGTMRDGIVTVRATKVFPASLS